MHRSLTTSELKQLFTVSDEGKYIKRTMECEWCYNKLIIHGRHEYLSYQSKVTKMSRRVESIRKMAKRLERMKMRFTHDYEERKLIYLEDEKLIYNEDDNKEHPVSVNGRIQRLYRELNSAYKELSDFEADSRLRLYDNYHYHRNKICPFSLETKSYNYSLNKN